MQLPGLESDDGRVSNGAWVSDSRQNRDQTPVDPVLATYLRRLAARGAARKGIAAYRSQMAALVRCAGRLSGRQPDLVDLFREPALLGRALVDDRGCVGGHQLSKWTLAQRRSAVRSFAALMRPELVVRLGEDPDAVLDRALRDVAERVGGGYRLTGGAPRGRGGYVPTAAEIGAVIAAAEDRPGFVGLRNRAFFGILAATGARVDALRRLDGADCVLLPSGRLRLFLHEKGKQQRREVELRAEDAAALRAYADAFDRHAGRFGWSAFVRLGAPSPVWRNSGRGLWSYADVLATLRAACATAGVPAFTPHAFRRAFATDAASVLPRHTVALAGGWRGLDRLDDHYVRPRQVTIWYKLLGRERPEYCSREVTDAVGDAVAAV
jgi:integrase